MMNLEGGWRRGGDERPQVCVCYACSHISVLASVLLFCVLYLEALMSHKGKCFMAEKRTLLRLYVVLVYGWQPLMPGSFRMTLQ